ncbi:PTS system cellobiose-specific IIB component [Anaerosolibacter carboniphilus]|uniref:PTS system cellobiose-specific IIB component n=1 Tax=Anaerosolibacter carboniphilus TaxID=1417629 RepID=A0A841KW17_9FIRM|nr:PTS sugar transporter subunit IIB [Anaerosolibacter carboniphilus]MBB6214379.1 PTS system cellobiose-specific IIB component [Anaerosolibacter carboniphilus]
MKKIMLVCSAGMSTSLLVKKMAEYAQKQGIEVEVFAVSEADVINHEDIDVVLLGPQVRYLLSKLQPIMEPMGVPVAVIESIHYGMMNGEAVVKQAMAMMPQGE